jgi:hypothetical protein
MPAITERRPERERGSVWQLRRESLRRPGEIDPAIREDLWQAPIDREAQVSQIEANIYEGIELVFPLLLRRQFQHRMKATQFYSELDMILGMADIREPDANVFVYSLQVVEPQNFGDRLNKMVLDLVPPNLLPEIVNGYFRHEILYELSEPERSVILVNAIQTAAKIELSLKPPWSQYRTSVLVTLA